MSAKNKYEISIPKDECVSSVQEGAVKVNNEIDVTIPLKEINVDPHARREVGLIYIYRDNRLYIIK